MKHQSITDGGWENAYDEQFGKLTLGTLSGEKGSPVFVNNDLEVPRLKTFIRTQISEAVESKLEEAAKAVEEAKRADVFSGWGLGHTTALDEAAQIIRSLKDTSHTEKREKLEAAAKDFDERFTPVMKELAEEEGPWCTDVPRFASQECRHQDCPVHGHTTK